MKKAKIIIIILFGLIFMTSLLQIENIRNNYYVNQYDKILILDFSYIKNQYSEISKFELFKLDEADFFFQLEYG